MTNQPRPSLRLDFVGGSEPLVVDELADMLESDQTIEEALDGLKDEGSWIDQSRLVEHGPRAYHEVRVVDAEAFAHQLACYTEDLKTQHQTVRMDVAVTLTAAIEVPSGYVPEHLSHQLNRWPENLLNACREKWSEETGLDPAFYDSGEVEITHHD